MSTLVRTELTEQQPLQPVTARGWRRGFANLLRKELGQWWGTRRWWVQLIIWLAILNGITTIMMLEDPPASGPMPVEQVQQIVRTFFLMGAVVTAVEELLRAGFAPALSNPRSFSAQRDLKWSRRVSVPAVPLSTGAYRVSGDLGICPGRWRVCYAAARAISSRGAGAGISARSQHTVRAILRLHAIGFSLRQACYDSI